MVFSTESKLNGHAAVETTTAAPIAWKVYNRSKIMAKISGKTESELNSARRSRLQTRYRNTSKNNAINNNKRSINNWENNNNNFRPQEAQWGINFVMYFIKSLSPKVFNGCFEGIVVDQSSVAGTVLIHNGEYVDEIRFTVIGINGQPANAHNPNHILTIRNFSIQPVLRYFFTLGLVKMGQISTHDNLSNGFNGKMDPDSNNHNSSSHHQQQSLNRNSNNHNNTNSNSTNHHIKQEKTQDGSGSETNTTMQTIRKAQLHHQQHIFTTAPKVNTGSDGSDCGADSPRSSLRPHRSGAGKTVARVQSYSKTKGPVKY